MSAVEVFAASEAAPPRDRLASYLGAIGRGPGRSRPLSLDEARDAFRIVLSGDADPMQVGALLLLMRYRGESAPELAGFVEAARAHVGAPPLGSGVADLDWPSYAAGRSRGAPWFLLSALLVAGAGFKVVVHGHNSAFLQGTGTERAARELGIPICADLSVAESALRSGGIVYLPLESVAPDLFELVGLRSLLGLRSPVNSMVRLLNPLGSLASTVGVFHPAYRDLHRDTAKLLGWRNLAVVKGGGGEFELNPLKTTSVHRIVAGESRDHATAGLIADARGERPTRGTLDELVAVWNGHRRDAAAEAIVIATAAVALATVSESDPAQHVREAQDLWTERRTR
jgi:anthranilate phosphoribosyltransferase